MNLPVRTDDQRARLIAYLALRGFFVDFRWNGLKNLSVGSARVSEVHGNFIVNDGGARAEDVLQLIALIQSRAREARQIDLNTEVIVLGVDN